MEKKDTFLCHCHVTVSCLQNTGFSSHAMLEENQSCKLMIVFRQMEYFDVLSY